MYHYNICICKLTISPTKDLLNKDKITYTAEDSKNKKEQYRQWNHMSLLPWKLSPDSS
jgi:hypothetical protein